MNFDIVVIGGNPAGSTAAVTAKKMNKNKSVLVIRKEPKSLIPCGIPYTFGTLDNIEDDIKPITGAQKAGVEFLFNEVVSVDANQKELTLKTKEKVTYDKLIFATGSNPFVPPITGHDLPGVVTISKEFEYIKKVNNILANAKKVVVIGAGFIGVEVSDEIAKSNKEVTLIESMDSILPLAFDKDVIGSVKNTLIKHGVILKTGEMVKAIIEDDGKVSGVSLKNGETIEADMVILSIGYRPNSNLAKDTGLEISKFGGIVVDEYLRTSEKDIFAVGDCVSHKDFFSHKPSNVMLASTGASEARIAGMNLYDIKVVRQSKGSIAIFSTSLGEISIAAAGMTEHTAVVEGFNVVVGKSEGKDQHPGKLPHCCNQTVKLVFAEKSRLLLGAQITGGQSTGEMINILGLALQKNMTAVELSVLQYGTHPKLTAGPGLYPIVSAAIDALCKMDF